MLNLNKTEGETILAAASCDNLPAINRRSAGVSDSGLNNDGLDSVRTHNRIDSMSAVQDPSRAVDAKSRVRERLARLTLEEKVRTFSLDWLAFLNGAWVSTHGRTPAR